MGIDWEEIGACFFISLFLVESVEIEADGREKKKKVGKGK